MELLTLLQRIELFTGLDNDQFSKLAAIVEHRQLKPGEVVFQQGTQGDQLYIVKSGFVEVIVDETGHASERTIVHLGPGQSVGEMALVDQGSRSATVRATGDETVIVSLSRRAFENLCESDTAIGYIVMKNIAADLSFKLRHRTLNDN